MTKQAVKTTHIPTENFDDSGSHFTVAGYLLSMQQQQCI